MLQSLLLFLILSPAVQALSLPLCTDPTQLPEGYTYTVDPGTGERVWSHCKFPDPRFDHAFCGMPESSDPFYLCDPDLLLSANDNVVSINNQLRSIHTNTSTQCRGPDGVKQSFVVAIIMVDRIRVGAPYQTDSCINDCGEIYPTLNTTARAPTSSELDVAMENFADGLRRELGLGACGNDAVTFYSKTYNRVYTSMGSKVAAVLDSDTLSDIHSRFLEYVKSGRLEEALLYVAQKFRSELRGLAPADIMLIITMVCAVVLLLFVLFYFQLNDTDYNAWGNEKGWVVADIVVKSLTGLYLLEWSLMAMTQISGRVPLWIAVVMFAVFIACMVVYFVTDIDKEMN